MRSAVTCAAWIGVAVFAAGEPLLAQLRDNTEKQMTCQNGGYDSDRVRHCEMREQTVPAIGRLNVDANRNGGVTVKGWLRNEVLVRARVEASAENEGAAANLASRVSIDGSGGQVRATGPESVDNNNSWWSVSYEIFVPQNTDLTATARNGGINISDVRGQIRFEGRNGGVHLKRLAGDVIGSTVNGGIAGGVDRHDLGWAAIGSHDPERRGERHHAAVLLGAHPGRERKGRLPVGFSSHRAGQCEAAPAGLQCRCRRSADSRHDDKRPREFHARGLAVGGKRAKPCVAHPCGYGRRSVTARLSSPPRTH